MPHKHSGLRIAAFASGRGSNFSAIVDAIESGELKSKAVGVISNNPDSGVIEFAESKEIPYKVINRNRYPDESELNNKILDTLDEWNANFIVLAGYMKKIDLSIVRKFKNRILNIHPALLPSFGGNKMYGLTVHESVLNYGVKYSGVTVHIVTDEYDKGPIVLQQVVPVYDDDTAEILQKRILKEEHTIYKEAIRLFEEDLVIVLGQRVVRKRENAED